MATKTSYYETKKIFFNNQKIKMKKELARLSKLINTADPESPQYTKYIEQKEALTVKLYGVENDYDKVVNKLTKDVQELRETVEKKAKDRTFQEKLKEDISKKLEPLTRKVDAIQDSYAYRVAKAGAKLTGKLGLSTGKMILNTLLTKKVNQKKFLGIKYGGKRVGRFKFNDGLLKKYSSDYKELGKNFYLMGKGLYNKDIKKGQLDAGDIITYMREQGESSEEILNALKKFNKYGLAVSSTYTDLLQQEIADKDKDGLVGYDDVNNRNQAILINDQNKESLKEALFDFYDYIESSKPKKNKGPSIFKMLGSLIKGAWKVAKWLLMGLLTFGATGLGAIVLGAIAATIYFWGDEIVLYAKKLANQLSNWIIGEDIFDISEEEEETSSSLARCYKDIDDMPMPKDSDFDKLNDEAKVLFDANGEDIDKETQKAISEYAKEQGISEVALAGIIQTESNFDPNAVSSAGAKGLMQFMPETWKDEGHGSVFNPTENVKAGAQYYKKLLDRYDGDEVKALAAYNWGMGKVDEAIKTYGEDSWLHAAPVETQEYIKRNFANREAIIQANSPLGKEDKDLDLVGDFNAELDAAFNMNEDTDAGITPPSYTPQYSNPDTPINTSTNSNIIKEEEEYQQSLKPSESKPATPPKKSGVDPNLPAAISIPYHLGGGDLNLLNYFIR